MPKEKKDFYDCSVIIKDFTNDDVDVCLKFHVDSFQDAIDKLNAFPVKGCVTDFIFGDFHTVKKTIIMRRRRIRKRRKMRKIRRYRVSRGGIRL